MSENRGRNGLLSRDFFDRYVYEHEHDPEAHGDMRHRYGDEGIEVRVRSLETWRTFTAGGLAVVALEVTGGLLVVLAHLAHIF